MLKFITEEYLRDLYRKEPFDSFQITEEEKLTPGGRQYLLDKKIEINTCGKKNEKVDLNKNVEKKHIYKLKSIDMEIYSLVSELLYRNIKTAHNMLEAGEILKNITSTLEGKTELLKFEDEVPCVENIDPLESYLYFKNGKYIFLLKRIVYELLICKEIFLFNEGIAKNFNLIVNKVEEVICEMTEGI